MLLSSVADPSPQESLTDALCRLIQPIGVKALYGLTFHGEKLLAVDPFRGYLLGIDPLTDSVTILNSQHVEAFEQVTGLAVWGERLWLARENSVLICSLNQLTPAPLIRLPHTVDGVAVWQNTLYVSCRKAGYIFIYDGTSGKRITRFAAPGIGVENLAVWGDHLWVSDQLEQTVYCLDRATGEIQLKVLTPFPTPTGLAVLPHTEPSQGTVWVAYAQEEPYVRDDPNGETQFELTFRDRTFIHPLRFAKAEAAPAESAAHRRAYALSNGYQVEMTYVEEIDSLDALELQDIDWRIALPTDTDRQRVQRVESIGIPFTEEHINGQRVAKFHFDCLKPHERHIFGWRAIVEVYGIKYDVTPQQVESGLPLPEEYAERYLIDDDELAMDTPTIQAAARISVRNETNLLRQVLSIRNYVYDCLSYAVTPAIETPDVVLQRGRGSCGEYVGLLLALLRLNGIACRTVGRYKCPPGADRLGVFLEPDFNHVWIEFLIPGYGWVPMESNPDDVQEGGPYPTRFFMGLPWWHVEMAKDVPFEKLALAPDSPEVRLGDLAVNHVRFRVLQEVAPWDMGCWATES